MQSAAFRKKTPNALFWTASDITEALSAHGSNGAPRSRDSQRTLRRSSRRPQSATSLPPAPRSPTNGTPGDGVWDAREWALENALLYAAEDGITLADAEEDTEPHANPVSKEKIPCLNIAPLALSTPAKQTPIASPLKTISGPRNAPPRRQLLTGAATPISSTAMSPMKSSPSTGAKKTAVTKSIEDEIELPGEMPYGQPSRQFVLNVAALGEEGAYDDAIETLERLIEEARALCNISQSVAPDPQSISPGEPA